MRIRSLQTGIVRERVGSRGVRRYLWAPWQDDGLPVNAFLVEHPRGLCLFDTGQTARAAQRGYFPAWHPFFRLARFELTPEDEAAAQLRSIAVDPDDVRWVVLSHLHTDHVGGMSAFTRSEALVDRVEWQRAQGMVGRVRGYLPQYWPGAEPTLLDFWSGGFGPFSASYDLTGDGDLIVVSTPGHTPGHVSLLVKRPGASVLLGGDLARDLPDLKRKAPEIARYCAEHAVSYCGAHDRDAPSILARLQTT